MDNNSFKDAITGKKYHPWLWFLIVLVLIVIGGAGMYTQNMYQNAKTVSHQTYQTGISYRDTSSIIRNRKPFSILLLGTDTGALGRHDKGRTDTIILATVNPVSEKITLTSIPRDTKLQNINNDSNHPDKINNAYTVGGASNAERTVKNFIHVPIDYYAVINMGGLEKMVNAVGGVTLTPNLSFKYGATNVKKGKSIHLNGKQALDYCRMRHQDPLGDYGRQARQRQVIQKLIFKGLQISSVAHYQDILDSLHGNLLTNMKFHDMLMIRLKYAHATQHLQSHSLFEKSQMYKGVSYQVANPNTVQKVSNTLNASLN